MHSKRQNASLYYSFLEELINEGAGCTYTKINVGKYEDTKINVFEKAKGLIILILMKIFIIDDQLLPAFIIFIFVGPDRWLC